MNNKSLIIKTGHKYIIDEGFKISGEVEVVKIYGNHFCRVKNPENGSEWDTMIYRLSELK